MDTDLSEEEDLDPISHMVALDKRYHAEFGVPPVHLSHWDPDIRYRSWVSRTLRLPAGEDFVSYFFTYDAEELKCRLSQHLGLTAGAGVRLLTNCSTVSIVSIIHWLRLTGVTRIILFGPFYFSVLHACRALALPYEIRRAIRNNDGTYNLPKLPRADLTNRVAVWITNPIYSSGAYIRDGEAQLRALLDIGVRVVLDETLAVPELSLGHRLAHAENCVAIYSPHKTLNINGVKFSYVVGTRQFEDRIEQWADVFNGGLTTSATTAIRHFLSANFGLCRSRMHRFAAAAYRRICDASSDGCRVSIDRWEAGNFATCYFSDVPGELAFDHTAMWNLVRDTAAVVFPTTCSYADRHWGFGFRLNLTRLSPEFLAAFSRIVSRFCRSSAAFG